MSLELDTRQRAMLQEMGITVWQPEPVYITEHSVEVPEIAINKIAVQAVNTPATAINAPPRAVSERTPVNLPANPPVKQIIKQPATPAVALQPMPAGLQEMDWATLQQTAQDCQACQLCAGRKGIVFGTPASAQQADWLIVGDPPTESDEAAGAAFTGEAGVLLGNMLKAMGLSAEQVTQQVTLTPAVKCRTEGQNHFWTG